jgi:hypothetical protein
MKLALLSLLLLPPLLLAGCDKKAGGPTTRATVRDSAGVTIVETPLPPTAVQTAVDSIPVWSIGGGVGGSDYDLNEIRGSVRLSDGRIVVADNLAGELRFFDSTGNFLQRGGRKGKGPGEFEQMMGVWALPGDTLAIYDIATRRISLFNPGGTFVRQVDLGKAGFFAPTGMLDDGTIVGSGFSFNPDSLPAKGTRRRNTLPVLLIAADGASTDTMATFEGLEMYTVEASFGGRTFPSPLQVQFGLNTTLGTWGDQIYVGDNARPEIMVYDRDGTLRRVIRSSYTPVTVTEAHRKAQEEQNLEQWAANPFRGMPKEMMDQVEGWIREAMYAERFPAYQAFFLDREGNLWVQEYAPGQPQQFRVYSPLGEFMVRTALPPDVRPLDIGRDYVIGAFKDDDGLEHIRLYRTPVFDPKETAR